MVVAVLIALGGYVGFHHIAPYAITQPGRISLEMTPADFDLKSTPLDIEVADSIRLKGYWIDSNLTTTRGAVILVHGIGGCKEHFISLSRDLADLGIASILVEQGTWHKRRRILHLRIS